MLLYTLRAKAARRKWSPYASFAATRTAKFLPQTASKIFQKTMWMLSGRKATWKLEAMATFRPKLFAWEVSEVNVLQVLRFGPSLSLERFRRHIVCNRQRFRALASFITCSNPVLCRVYLF